MNWSLWMQTCPGMSATLPGSAHSLPEGQGKFAGRECLLREEGGEQSSLTQSQRLNLQKEPGILNSAWSLVCSWFVSQSWPPWTPSCVFWVLWSVCVGAWVGLWGRTILAKTRKNWMTPDSLSHCFGTKATGATQKQGEECPPALQPKRKTTSPNPNPNRNPKQTPNPKMLLFWRTAKGPAHL